MGPGIPHSRAFGEWFPCRLSHCHPAKALGRIAGMNPSLRRIISLAGILALAGCSTIEDHTQPQTGGSKPAPSPFDVPLGNHSFKVTTTSAPAQRAFDRGLTLAYAFSHEFVEEFGPMLDGYMIFPSEALMRFGKWREILAEPAPRPGLPLSMALWHFTRGVALTGLNRLEDARREQADLSTASALLPAGNSFGNNPASNLVVIASHVLAGELAARAPFCQPGD